MTNISVSIVEVLRFFLFLTGECTLNYLIIFFVIISLGLLALREWLMSHRPSPQKIKRLQNDTARHIVLGEWNLAKKSLKLLINKRLAYPETAILHIQVLRGLNQSDHALFVADKFLTLFPQQLTLHHERAKTLMDLGRPKEALYSFERCKTLLHRDDDFADYIQALLLIKEVDAAWSILQPVIKRTKHGRLLALAGDCQFHKENHAQAILQYKQAQKNDWEHNQTSFRLGLCFKSLGNYVQAQEFFRALLDENGSDVVLAYELGTCFEAQGDFTGALACYQERKIWEQGDARILRQAGICAIYTKQYQYAEIYLGECMKKGNHTPQVLAFYAHSLECQHLWKEAEALYLRLTEDFPLHVWGFRALAWLYGVGLSDGLDADLGLSMAQRALELQPDSTSWEILSACEARSGNFDKAHHIQEHLSCQTKDKLIQMRRRKAMRILRQKVPLNETQVSRVLVA